MMIYSLISILSIFNSGRPLKKGGFLCSFIYTNVPMNISKNPRSAPLQNGGILKGRISISHPISDWIVLLCPIFWFSYRFSTKILKNNKKFVIVAKAINITRTCGRVLNI